MFNQSTFPNSQVIQIPNDNTYAAAAKNVNPYNKFLAAEAFVNISPIQIMTSNLELLLHYCDPSARVNHLNNFNNKSNNNEEAVIVETPLPPPPPPLISALSTIKINDETTTSTSTTITANELTTTISNNNTKTSVDTTTTTTTNETGININELYEGNNNNIITSSTVPIIQDGDNKSVGGATTTTITTINTIDNNSCHLRKNTPIGLPLIIKQAIENKSKVSPKKLSRLSYHHDIGGLRMPKIDDQLPPPPPPPPPETPSIESAPLNIDFQQLTNKQNDPLPPPPPLPLLYTDGSDRRKSFMIKNVLSNSNDNSINNSSNNSSDNSGGNTSSYNQSNLDDNNKETDFIASILALRFDDQKSTETSNSNNDNDDEDTELQEYNSANYWYISPDLPLDFDNSLEFDDIFETSKLLKFIYLFFVYVKFHIYL